LINNAGVVPPLKTILYNGEEMYHVTRTDQTLMKKYKNAVGISTFILKEMDSEMFIIVDVTFSDRIERFGTSVKKFLESQKTYMNIGSDEQKFVSINDMKLLETKVI